MEQVVTLLTPTGARPSAFALCEKWFRNQTIHTNPKYKIQWLCVDDYAKEPTNFTCNQIKVAAPKQWTPEINTQRYNLDALMEKATGDIIVNWEDDEYYAPEYLEEMVKLLGMAQIAGISNDRYYHIKAKGYKLIGNWRHASLCRTVIRKEIKNLLYQSVHSGQYYFDIDLWTRVREKEIPMNLIAHASLSVGIKGMPGRAGLGAVHAIVGYANDKTLDKFKEWVGRDWESYTPYLK